MAEFEASGVAVDIKLKQFQTLLAAFNCLAVCGHIEACAQTRKLSEKNHKFNSREELVRLNHFLFPSGTYQCIFSWHCPFFAAVVLYKLVAL